MFRPLLALSLAVVFLLGACASTLTTQVTSFHQLSDGLRGQRFVIMPTAEQESSLEFESYANMVREALAGRGLVDARNEGGTADLGVSLAYEVVGRGTGVRDGTRGYAGFGASSGGGFSMGGVGIGIGFPVGGFGGSGESVLYQRSLTVQIERLSGGGQARAPASETPATGAAPAPSSRVFEARALSEGPSASLAPVMRAMVNAIFDDFPGASGTTRMVQAPVDETP